MISSLAVNYCLSAKVGCLVLGMLVLALLTNCSSMSEETEDEPKPNIILVLTDDLDATSIPLSRMANIKRYMVDQGTTFENAFVTNPLCCPSRVTILRGQYSHNHGVLTNGPPDGGFKKFNSLGREKSTVATWLQNGGYRTVLIGRYLNDTPRGQKPPGWNEVHGGGYKAADVHHTDWFADKASSFIRSTKGKRKPFFIYLATKSPHRPAIPAARHADAFPGVKAPRPPSFNEQDVSDKPGWISDKRSLSARGIDEIDKLYRKRLQSMLAIDEMIEQLVGSLSYSGKLENTYIVFSSDHGFSQGEHRRKWGKGAAYEESIRVPLIVRGPSVPQGKTREHMVLNNDLAPTIAQLGGVNTPSFVDGRSLEPLLRSYPPPPSNWRSRFLVEGYDSGERSVVSPYKAVRTEDHLWVEYTNGERELYDLSTDPYQLQSLHDTASRSLRQTLSSELDELRSCARERCRDAEGF